MPTFLEHRDAILFANAKELAITASSTPVFPEYARKRFRSVLERTTIVDDAEFLEIGRSTSPNPNHSEMAEGIKSWAKNNMGLVFSIKDERIVPPTIAIRKAAFQQVDGKSYFFDLLAEEIAHSFRQRKELNLAKIPDGSRLITPCDTKLSLAEALNQQRRDYLGLVEPIDLQGVTVVQEGFMSTFIEIE